MAADSSRQSPLDLDLDAISEAQIERALRRYWAHHATDDQVIRWLGSMRPQTRIRYALRLAALDDQLAAGAGGEIDRSLAYAIVRAERDVDLCAQRVELDRKREGPDGYRRSRQALDAAQDRHTRLLELWWGSGRSTAGAPSARKQRAGTTRGRALIESMLSEEADGETPPGGEPDGAAEELIG